MARIGILGGTFDPPHNGHIAIANAALTGLELQKVIFIPAKIQPLKAKMDISSAKDRLAMLRLALAGLSQFEISEIELKREGLSYTIDTLSELYGTYETDYLYLIIGADNIGQLEKWYDVDRILKLCTIAAANRTGYLIEGKYKEKIVFFDMNPVNISSTEIRNRVRKHASIDGMAPSTVIEYIFNHKLYRDYE